MPRKKTMPEDCFTAAEIETFRKIIIGIKNPPPSTPGSRNLTIETLLEYLLSDARESFITPPADTDALYSKLRSDPHAAISKFIDKEEARDRPRRAFRVSVASGSSGFEDHRDKYKLGRKDSGPGFS